MIMSKIKEINAVETTSTGIKLDSLTNSINIKISDDTRKLIQCRALLSDVYNNVSEVIQRLYPESEAAKTLDPLLTAFGDMDVEIQGITNEVIDSNIYNLSNDNDNNSGFNLI